MFRSSIRPTVKNSASPRSRFAPRLESLESRYAPACSFNPATGDLIAGDFDTVLLYYLPSDDAQDVYCNSQYVGKSFGDIYLHTPNFAFVDLEIDTTLSTTAGTYLIDHDYATFGNTIYFDDFYGPPESAAFILGNAPNYVIVETGYPNITVVGWSGSQPAKVFYHEHVGTASYTITQNAISPDGLGGDIEFFNVNEISIIGDAKDTTYKVKNTAGSLGTMPKFFLYGSGGTDTLTIDASAYSAPEKYSLDEERFSMPDYLNGGVWYDDIESVALKAGTNIDFINISSTEGTLDGLPALHIDGGGGANTLTLSDAGYDEGSTYNVTNNHVGLPARGVNVGYSNIKTLNLTTGPEADFANIGNPNATISGLPDLTINTGDGADVVNFADSGNPNSDAYNFVRYTSQVTNFSTPTLGLAKLYNAETTQLITGVGANEVNVVNGVGVIPSGLAFNVFGTGSGDTLNYKDFNNTAATTYVVTSSGAGTGSVDVPVSGFSVSFSQSIGTVNLYKNANPGTIVDTSGYNPAHYVLSILSNITALRAVQPLDADNEPYDPVISPWNPSPIAPPPIQNPDQISTDPSAHWATPLLSKRWRRSAETPVNWPTTSISGLESLEALSTHAAMPQPMAAPRCDVEG